MRQILHTLVGVFYIFRLMQSSIKNTEVDNIVFIFILLFLLGKGSLVRFPSYLYVTLYKCTKYWMYNIQGKVVGFKYWALSESSKQSNQYCWICLARGPTHHYKK